MTEAYGLSWDGRLEEWLNAIEAQDPEEASGSSGVQSWAFPTDELVKQYVATIDSRPEAQVRHLLRCFLFEYVTFTNESLTLEFMKHVADPDKLRSFESTEYGQRLLNVPRMVHPGVRWVLDLLPGYPQQAAAVVESYALAHAQFLPDGRLTGLSDASTLIAAKYGRLRSTNGREVLRRLSSRQLEQLTARLYTEMGYECILTQRTRDGGRDVIAIMDRPGRREHRLIDCAHYAGTVPVTKARAILGVADTEKATSAVLLTTGGISATARKEAALNKKLDLVDGERLIDLLDQYLGRDWTMLIAYWTQWPPRR
ncbi:restriction endonuclease [Paenarthrobacter nicotinovorans]|uniref:restriction endonuclease n=1 Tax=Paenarthrobacter nicotinovorans TaxID=29320 RepID=UPI0039A5405B